MKLTDEIIKESRRLFNPLTLVGNKVSAIKYLRQETGCGLKEGKTVLEDNFSTQSIADNGFTYEKPISIGIVVDRILYLTSELASCYDLLKSTGYEPPKK